MSSKEEYSANGLGRQPSIFISHSSKDIAVARAVRNLFEARNHRFVGLIGLASLEEKSAIQQCQFLLEEIASRDWLVLIDSENAQGSFFVQFEIATAKVLRKPFYTIDAKQVVKQGNQFEVESILRPSVESLSRGLRIYISYSRQDRLIAENVAHWLAVRGYETFTDAQLRLGVPWKDHIQEEIQKAAEHGVMIVLLSKNWLASDWTSYELELARQMGGRVLPVALEPVELPESLAPIQILDISRFESIHDGMLGIWRELNRIRHEIFQEHCGGVILNDWPGIEQSD